jgi:hypothetical protein
MTRRVGQVFVVLLVVCWQGHCRCLLLCGASFSPADAWVSAILQQRLDWQLFERPTSWRLTRLWQLRSLPWCE